MVSSPYCPEYAPFFGFLGAALALVFGNMGAAYGTWKSALGLATIAKLPRHKVQTEMVMKSIMPVILSGVCGIFGLIIAVIISSGMRLPTGAGQTTACIRYYGSAGDEKCDIEKVQIPASTDTVYRVGPQLAAGEEVTVVVKYGQESGKEFLYPQYAGVATGGSATEVAMGADAGDGGGRQRRRR